MNNSCFLDKTKAPTTNITGITMNKYLWTNDSSIPNLLFNIVAATESIPLNWNPPNPNTAKATKHTAYKIPNLGFIKSPIYSFGVLPIILEFNVSE